MQETPISKPSSEQRSEKLIDAHAHVDRDSFGDERNKVIRRALDGGLSHIIHVGIIGETPEEASSEALELCDTFPEIYCTLGIHPHDAGKCTAESLELIRERAKHPKVVAIGEIGLDYFYDHSPHEVQQDVFRKFLRLAHELKKPVVIHSRDALDDTMQILKEENIQDIGGMMHCYPYDYETAKKCLDWGMYISFTGVITFKKADELREVARKIPIERILIETDCPYLTPVPFRGKRNEPSYVKYTAEKLAELKGLAFNDIARITSRNAKQFFGLMPKDNNPFKIVYPIRNSLYINLTNRCTNACVFCAKQNDFTVKGHLLKLKGGEPSVEQVMQELEQQQMQHYDEVVFCGYGEPTIRLNELKQIAKQLKQRGMKTRLNTDGQANLREERNIIPELVGLIDSNSVSMNAADHETYGKLCPGKYPSDIAFGAVRKFVQLATQSIPDVTATAVGVPGLDLQPIENLALALGAQFRSRIFNEVG